MRCLIKFFSDNLLKGKSIKIFKGDDAVVDGIGKENTDTGYISELKDEL